MEDYEALKIHGYKFSDEPGDESDSGKSEFDQDYYKALPPVHRVDPSKVVMIRVEDRKNNLNTADDFVEEQISKASPHRAFGTTASSTSSIYKIPTTSVKVRSSHRKTDISKQLSQSRQRLLLNPATLPRDREHVRSSTTVINQPTNASTAANNGDDINLMETEDSKCFSCILCLIKCCVCDCVSK